MKVKLGEGILNWERSERISDRYGAVQLFAEPYAMYGDNTLLKLDHTAKEGTFGKLIAHVTEQRTSTHIGDLFHGFYPQTPELDEDILLGEGYLFYDGLCTVGLMPKDKRKTFWLTPQELYRAHEQKVILYFEETSKTTREEEQEAKFLAKASTIDSEKKAEKTLEAVAGTLSCG